MKKHLHALGKLLPIALFLLCLSSSKLQAQNLTQTPVQDSVYPYIKGYYECLPLDYNKYPAKKYPLLIFIHGIGELGNGSTDLYKVLKNGPPKLIDQHQFSDSFVVGGKTFSFIVISPQLTINDRDPKVVNAMINYCVKKYRVDQSRIYLTGLSMGGGISWIYASATGSASRLAALLDVCGNATPSTTGVQNIATSNLPVWATHNINDPTVSSTNSIRWVDSLNAFSPSINPKALLNLFNEAYHDAWTQTYNPTWRPNGLNVFEWMLQYTRPSAATLNQVPIVNAGVDQSTSLPKDSLILSGTANDADGKILFYHWTKINGPDSATIVSANAAQTKITGLKQGSYTFRLTATDDAGDSTSDDMIIVVNPAVNQAPKANAGSDQTITLPTCYTPLSGSGVDVDGSIVKYRWKKVAGPANFTITDTTIAKPIVKNLKSGTYTFRLTVTDNGGLSNSDSVIIKVNIDSSAISSITSSIKPVANAGADQTLTLPNSYTTLSGSGTETGGTIVKYRWKKVAGPYWFTISDTTIAKPTVKNLRAGTYIFRLTVTDGNGASNADSVNVIVDSVSAASALFSSASTEIVKYVKVNIYGGSNPYSDAAWNNWNVGTASATNINSGIFKYSDGTTSSISAVLSHSQNNNDNYDTYGSGMAPAEVLRYDSYDVGTRTLTISGLVTSKSYSLELYASRRSSGNSTIFTTGNASDTIATYNNLSNKTTFNDLVPDAQGNLVITIKNQNQYNYLNGFSLTENSNSQTSSTSSGMINSNLQFGLTKPEIVVNPNPFSDKFLMQINNTYIGTMKVQLIDMNGAVRKEFKLMKTQSGTTQFYLSANELSTGTYILKAQMNDWAQSVKVIKQ